MWALGIVLFQLLVGRLPFNANSNTELFRQIERSDEHLKRLFELPEWASVSELAKDLVKRLLHPDPTKRLNADEALSHEWIALRGNTGGAGDLKSAQVLLKQQVAQKRLTALWHVLDIMNALDVTRPNTPKHKGGSPRLPPALLKRASEASTTDFGSAARLGRGGGSGGGSPSGRARLASTTDRMEELQTLFNLFDTDGNGTIDEHEIGALFRKLGFEADLSRMRKLMTRVDSNANGTLEFGEFCEFLRLAKSADLSGGGGGLGIGQAVVSSLDTLADESGCISNDALSQYLVAFAEASGQTISQAEIADVIALSADGADGGAMRTADIAHAMMLKPDTRHAEANARRATPAGSQASSAVMSGAERSPPGAVHAAAI